MGEIKFPKSQSHTPGPEQCPKQIKKVKVKFSLHWVQKNKPAGSF